jgi:hypothetical protein
MIFAAQDNPSEGSSLKNGPRRIKLHPSARSISPHRLLSSCSQTISLAISRVLKAVTSILNTRASTLNITAKALHRLAAGQRGESSSKNKKSQFFHHFKELLNGPFRSHKEASPKIQKDQDPFCKFRIKIRPYSLPKNDCFGLFRKSG